MKKLIVIIICISLLFCACSISNDVVETQSDDYLLQHINPCVVEPDISLIMTGEDKDCYQNLMDAVLSQSRQVVLSDSKEKNEFYIDQLKRSPFYFFLSSCEIQNNTIKLEYTYDKEKQQDIYKFMETEFLEICNYLAEDEDNDLDKILKMYMKITQTYKYDHTRTDNKTEVTDVFTYPNDEVYKALRDKKTICFGFAYIVRFCFLQKDIDCFNVYGFCKASQQAHMWNIIKYDDTFFNIDAAWDITDEGVTKLYHFGKTDNERFVDTITAVDFSTYHDSRYGKVECMDERFKLFRGIKRCKYSDTHEFYMVDSSKDQYIYNTQTEQMK